MAKSIVAGNWKMNGLKASIQELEHLHSLLKQNRQAACEVLICPPFTLLDRFVQHTKTSPIHIGAQNCHEKDVGAHTGDVSAQMLKDLGAHYVIVGHSERRTDHAETSEQVKLKAESALKQGLKAIICVGETEEQRLSGQAQDIVLQQVKQSMPDGATADSVIIAYEPVWAIGTGRIPTVQDIADMHGSIRSLLVDCYGADANEYSILYGGSVKAANASELMSIANVNGALVGGASLKALDFNGIIDAYRSV